MPAEQARRDDRDEQLERDGAETEPERAVVRAERHQRGNEAEVGERIDDRGDDVQQEEDERHQREVAVHRRAEKSRPAARLEANAREQAEHDDGAEQDEAHGACAARGVPEQLIRHRPSRPEAPEARSGRSRRRRACR